MSGSGGFRRLIGVDNDGARTPFIVGACVGEGATGFVHSIVGNSRSVLKLLKANALSVDAKAKILAMLSNPPSGIEISHAGQRHVQISWPERVVFSEEEDFVGFSMPMVDTTASAPLHLLLQRSERAYSKLRKDYVFRLYVALNLATVVSKLHTSGHHVVDLKPQNVRFYKDNGLVALIDCDGMSVVGASRMRHPANHYSEEYIAPEVGFSRGTHAVSATQLREPQDHFALAVIVFLLLNEGIHPFQGVPVANGAIPSTVQESIDENLYAYGFIKNPRQLPSPASLHSEFDIDTRALFDRAFCQPANRPTASEWHEHLKRLMPPDGDLALTECKKGEGHIKFHGRNCAHCERDRRGRKKFSSLTSSRTSTLHLMPRRSSPASVSPPTPAGLNAPTVTFYVGLLLAAILIGKFVVSIGGVETSQGPVNRQTEGERTLQITTPPNWISRSQDSSSQVDSSSGTEQADNDLVPSAQMIPIGRIIELHTELGYVVLRSSFEFRAGDQIVAGGETLTIARRYGELYSATVMEGRQMTLKVGETVYSVQ